MNLNQKDIEDIRLLIQNKIRETKESEIIPLSDIQHIYIDNTTVLIGNFSQKFLRTLYYVCKFQGLDVFTNTRKLQLKYKKEL